MDRATKRRLKKEERGRKKAARRPSVLLQEIWNLPNMLTMARIAMIPLFVWLTYDADPMNSLLAAVLFTVAAITDVVDGMLARRMNLITVLGKFLDPLADKLIVMAALVMMVRLGRIWASLVIILIARELIVSGLRAIAASEGLVIAAGQEGKWKTSLQLTAIIALCVHYTHPLDLIWVTYPLDYNLVGKVLLSVSTVFSVWSAVQYFRAFFQVLGTRGSPAAE
ncbi:MAG: CDP-diacylglycerol--glycerol-3-phosphate 3-phosphatidyltransferase [Myxococcota bacterium]|nr:CDP-diacylglycerol--glycerol-3-phosphate 3-phosphatidyltransferase [Myxococcota bacterium]